MAEFRWIRESTREELHHSANDFSELPQLQPAGAHVPYFRRLSAWQAALSLFTRRFPFQPDAFPSEAERFTTFVVDHSLHMS